MKQPIKVIVTFLFVIWVCYFLSFVFPLQKFALVPRTLSGLLGIFLSPFIHGSLPHLISNSISFAIFAVVLALLEGSKMWTKVMLMVVMGGILTWLLGRSAIHMGASGLIFSFFGYMLLAGWFSKKIKYMVVSICLLFFYSGMIFGVLPGTPGVSWEGHLFGFIAGVMVAGLYHKKAKKS